MFLVNIRFYMGLYDNIFIVGNQNRKKNNKKAIVVQRVRLCWDIRRHINMFDYGKATLYKEHLF